MGCDWSFLAGVPNASLLADMVECLDDSELPLMFDVC